MNYKLLVKCAIQLGDLPVLQYLCEGSNSKDVLDYDVLVFALRVGDLNICEFLIKNRTSINAADNFQGFTALHYAVLERRVDLCELLLKHGACPNHPDKYGNTPFHRVMHIAPYNYKHKYLVKLLISYGANCFLKNKNDQTILDIASYWGEDLTSLILGVSYCNE